MDVLEGNLNGADGAAAVFIDFVRFGGGGLLVAALLGAVSARVGLLVEALRGVALLAVALPEAALPPAALRGEAM